MARTVAVTGVEEVGVTEAGVSVGAGVSVAAAVGWRIISVGVAVMVGAGASVKVGGGGRGVRVGWARNGRSEVEQARIKSVEIIRRPYFFISSKLLRRSGYLHGKMDFLIEVREHIKGRLAPGEKLAEE